MPALPEVPIHDQLDAPTDDPFQARGQLNSLFVWEEQVRDLIKDHAVKALGNGLEIASDALRIKLRAGSGLLLDGTGLGFDITAAWSTGDVKVTLNPTPAAGWANGSAGGTIGNASSGATNRGNADTQALFELIWNDTNSNPSDAQIQDSAGNNTTRGASAAADFAANKRIPLPPIPGAALAFAGSGAGLTTRRVCQFWGAETRTVVQGNLPAAGVGYNDKYTDTAFLNPNQAPGIVVNGSGHQPVYFQQYPIQINQSDHGRTTANLGSGTALDINGPRVGFYAHIKL